MKSLIAFALFAISMNASAYCDVNLDVYAYSNCLRAEAAQQDLQYRIEALEAKQYNW